MKTILFSLLFAAVASSASAQIFQPATASNMLIGGIAGAVIGDHNHHQALAGAAIGAAAGYVWSAATEPRSVYYANSQPGVPVYYAAANCAPVVYAAPATIVVGGPGYCAPVTYVRPAYYGYGYRGVYGYARPVVTWNRGYVRYGRTYYAHPGAYRVRASAVYRR